MKINGMDMIQECSQRFDEYLKEIEEKHKIKLPDEQKIRHEENF